MSSQLLLLFQTCWTCRSMAVLTLSLYKSLEKENGIGVDGTEWVVVGWFTSGAVYTELGSCDTLVKTAQLSASPDRDNVLICSASLTNENINRKDLQFYKKNSQVIQTKWNWSCMYYNHVNLYLCLHSLLHTSTHTSPVLIILSSPTEICFEIESVPLEIVLN